MLKNNYHTHCKYCHHAQGDVKDYVDAAIKNGFKELGMSDHGPVVSNLCQLYGEKYAHFGGNMDLLEMELYLKDIEKVKNDYQNQITIYGGFETEFLLKAKSFYESLRLKCDYLNLGVHYFDHNDGICNTYDDKEMNNTSVMDYAKTCIEGMKSGLFTCLAHPDLFMYHYHNINGERKFDDAARKASVAIIEAAIKYDVYLELNANGLRSYGAKLDYHQWNYPWYEFWEIVKNYPDVKIIIGADAHNPDLLNCENIEKVQAFAKIMNLKVQDKMILKPYKKS